MFQGWATVTNEHNEAHLSKKIGDAEVLVYDEGVSVNTPDMFDFFLFGEGPVEEFLSRVGLGEHLQDVRIALAFLRGQVLQRPAADTQAA